MINIDQLANYVPGNFIKGTVCNIHQTVHHKYCWVMLFFVDLVTDGSIKGTVLGDFWMLVFCIKLILLVPLEVLWDDFAFYQKNFEYEIVLIERSTLLVDFLKNCSFKSCCSLHLFSNGLHSVSYTAENISWGLRYTRESPFHGVSYTA